MQEVISATGLPEDLIRPEIERILKDSGRSVENLTLEDLRRAMMVYLTTTVSDISQ